MRHLCSLMFFWILITTFCKCDRRSQTDRELKEQMRKLNLNENVPSVIKRTFEEWSRSKVSCKSVSLKSSEAEIKLRSPMRFSMKARIATHSKKRMLKVELWMEFHNTTQPVNLSDIYDAVIRPMDSRLRPTNQTSPEPVINQKGDLVELSFNATDLYNSSKILGKKYVSFRINVYRRGLKESAKELQDADLKAFLIIHEFEQECSDSSPIVTLNRYRRSLNLFKKNHSQKRRLSSRYIFKQNQQLARSMMNPLLGNDHDTFKQNHTHRRSAKTMLKKFHPDGDRNTRTSCGLRDWYVSFKIIGWNNFVVAPSGVRARTCSGICSFPMGSKINSTAHAHLQSFAYFFKGQKWPACCVPNDFEPLSMILYDGSDEMYFMANYSNMIAKGCACL